MQIAIEESLRVGKNTLGFLQKHGCLSRWYYLAEALLALNQTVNFIRFNGKEIFCNVM